MSSSHCHGSHFLDRRWLQLIRPDAVLVLMSRTHVVDDAQLECDGAPVITR